MAAEGIRLQVIGEAAVMLYVAAQSGPEALDRVRTATNAIERDLTDVVIDLIPSYASLLILYNAASASRIDMLRRLRLALDDFAVEAADTSREVILPVYYHPEVGADLEALAVRAGLSVEAAIELHAGIEYRAYAIGFAPGFVYLGDVDPRLAAPRLATPRVKVRAGTVGIADRQTGVYPADSPGGWNLLGRCPLPMFNPVADPPVPVAVGDRVRFESISRQRFLDLGGDLT